MRKRSLPAVLLSTWCLIQFLPVLQGDGPLPHRPHRHVHTSKDEMGEAEACRDVYNYKTPHPCTPGPQGNCAFVVTWRLLEGGVAEYHVMADVSRLVQSSPAVWLALGFSSSPNMGDTDVIACWHRPDMTTTIVDGFNTPADHRFMIDDESAVDESADDSTLGSVPEDVTLIHSGTGIENGTFSCKFQRLIDTGDTLQDKVLSQHHYVLTAAGSLAGDDNKDCYNMQTHVVRVATTCACDVTSCDKVCSCTNGFFYQMLKLHGIVMSISFLFLIPLGMVISRYYRMVFLHTWFKAHVTTVGIGVLWSLVGLGLVLTHTRGRFSVGPHQILGVLCLGLCVLQPILGFLRPKNAKTTWRNLFNIFHRSLAVIILSTSTVLLFLGVVIFHNEVVIHMLVVLSLFVVLNISFLLLLELLKKQHKFSSSPPVGYRKVLTPHDEDGTESEEEEEVYVKDEAKSRQAKTIKYRFEKLLLVAFILLNLAFSGTISMFIFYFDSKED